MPTDIASYQCVEDAATLREGLQDWREALRHGSTTPTAKAWRLARADGWVKVQPPGSRSKPAVLQDVPDVTLGRDPAMETAVVMINAPSVPGDANGLTTIALDQHHRRWLLRQGFLRRQHGDDITQAMFDTATRLRPVPVTMHAGRGRTWYQVAMLDAPPEQVQSQTAALIAHCALVRAHYDPASVMTSASLDIAATLTSTPETVSAYEVPPHAGYSVEGTHARIWQALHRRLAAHSISSAKAAPSGGFEVDLVILTKSTPLLVEIKTSADAASVHTAVGQLMLYRKIFPELARCEPVLLLPDLLKPILANAVHDCGITLARYWLDGQDFAFDPAFLARCGLPE